MATMKVVKLFMNLMDVIGMVVLDVLVLVDLIIKNTKHTV
jgi:hypothetical protein